MIVKCLENEAGLPHERDVDVHMEDILILTSRAAPACHYIEEMLAIVYRESVCARSGV
jgi:hypothetical protein